jgi:hypothetical protein
MTTLATAAQGWDIISAGLLALLGCVAVLALAAWATWGGWARRRLRRGRWVAGALLALAGTPLYAWTAFVILIGIAAFGCPPDAYECPL